MSKRLNYMQLSGDLAGHLMKLGQTLKQSTLGNTLIDLVFLRASQLNGCAFCVDMHVKEAKIHGERELRLHHAAIWHESSLFDAREKAAFEWTEALTQLSKHGVSDELYDRARAQFSEKELSDLTFAVGIINFWNRLSIGFRTQPGSADKIFGLEKAGLS